MLEKRINELITEILDVEDEEEDENNIGSKEDDDNECKSSGWEKIGAKGKDVKKKREKYRMETMRETDERNDKADSLLNCHHYVIVQPMLKAGGGGIDFDSMEGGKHAIFVMQRVAAGLSVVLHTPIPHLATVALAESQGKVQHRAIDSIVQLGHKPLLGQPEIKVIGGLRRRHWEGKE
uniref:Uncharacterized protein n=1 Tax=Romanomermis culicivorax TaxID=13658 RepID=A0A915KCP9_ROMCU